MTIRDMSISGLGYLSSATVLLQRARLASPEGGVWEAADLQWWWRMPRRSDAIDQAFWVDEDGPVAAVVLTDWGETWGCDPIVVPGTSTVPLSAVWARALEAIEVLQLQLVEVPVRDDDAELATLLVDSGFVPDADHSGITWMSAEDRPEVGTLPNGFVLVDRARETSVPHPMRRRNGDQLEDRLRQCSLYDPALDLAVVTDDGHAAGYALFWFDPVTLVGLVEPMRVDDAYQRRGLARAMLTAGLDRLAARGASRLKVGYSSDAARRLYIGSGFRVTATTRLYRRTRPPATS